MVDLKKLFNLAGITPARSAPGPLTLSVGPVPASGIYVNTSKTISPNTLFVMDEAYPTPTVKIIVEDFKRTYNHHGWSVSFKIISKDKEGQHLDSIPTNKAFISDTGKWFEFDNDKIGNSVESEEIQTLIISATYSYLDDLSKSLQYIKNLRLKDVVIAASHSVFP